MGILKAGFFTSLLVHLGICSPLPNLALCPNIGNVTQLLRKDWHISLSYMAEIES
jgi:hypothetical protein